jgi:hypothetical protein
MLLRINSFVITMTTINAPPSEQYFEHIEVTHNDILPEEECQGNLLKSVLPCSDTFITTEELTEYSDGADDHVQTGHQSAADTSRRRCMLYAILVGIAAAIAAITVVVFNQSGNTFSPQSAPAYPTSSRPSYAPVPLDENEEVSILGPDEKLLPGESVASPNERYLFEFTDAGGLKLSTSSGEVLWAVHDEVGATLSMQWDGNLVFRTASQSVAWRSTTSQHPDASLRLDNRGRLAVISSDGVTPLWMAGVPGGEYDSTTASSSSSLKFPVRGAFYYPWFPETWAVSGSPVFFDPTLGKYSNGDRTVQTAHVEALAYAHVDLAIASWWGPNSKKDRARITNLMDKSTQYGIKWTIYHEQERQRQPEVDELRADLAYLKKWFAWHEAWAHIDGKPLIFVWNKGDCDVSDRWMEASNDEWYVVVKKLDNTDCPSQPDHWHQYGPAKAVVHEEGYSFSVSPGFWQANQMAPRLPRVPIEDFRANVIAMVESGEPWQLITTFNEWGEGTAVESATEWESLSGYGQYMDVFNEIQ